MSVYFVLLVAPTLMPLPPDTAHLWNNLVRFAQFVLWGIWWPFVIVSMLLFGRLWCGVFCPEGSLSEWASKRSLNLKPVPRWIKWPGWPFLAFVFTTVYGQMTSVYEYPLPALLILGGSTVAAIIVGLLWGRDRRVWCRYLCPVNGVFTLLSRLAPVHFRTDPERWKTYSGPRPKSVICAPLINIRQLDASGHCHMCGRCSGYRGAIELKIRSPNREILSDTTTLTRWEQRLLLFGLLGVALAAFQWTASPWFVKLKLALAEWSVNRGWTEILQPGPGWWLLTDYPAQNDVFLWLDGLSLLIYLVVMASLTGGALWLCSQLAARVVLGISDIPPTKYLDAGWQLAECYTPLAAISAFLGLSMLTLNQLFAERVTVPALNELRALFLLLALVWSLYLGWRKSGQWTQQVWRRMLAAGFQAAGISVVIGQWLLLFYVW